MERSRTNQLFYGDNLEVLATHIKDDTVDLCYIDPPFNSKRDYNQIYNNIGEEDRAQVRAFIDTWTWNREAREGLEKFSLLEGGRQYPDKTKHLIRAFAEVLGQGGMLAYLIHMALRLVEIRRVLKPTGSFFLHCDRTTSHYLKLLCDSIFCAQGGEFLNEIIWKRNELWKKYSESRFDVATDSIFWYSKSGDYLYLPQYVQSDKDPSKSYRMVDDDGRRYQTVLITGHKSLGVIRKGMFAYKGYTPEYGWRVSRKELKALDKQGLLIWKNGECRRYKQYLDERTERVNALWTDIVSARGKERLGYPTQKPEALLQRIIEAASKPGDLVLDAYCGCGTTIVAAQQLGRKWLGIDITYQSISLIIKRLTDTFGQQVMQEVNTYGIPRDISAATALAHYSTARKEFEIWAVMSYTDNRAIPNERRGADKGIDGKMYFAVSCDGKTLGTILFSVKSGHVGVQHIREFSAVIAREKAAAGVFLTLQPPTEPMRKEAEQAGQFQNPLTGIAIPRLTIVTIQEMLDGARANFPNTIDVLGRAKKAPHDTQRSLPGV